MDITGPTAWGLGSFFQPGMFTPGNVGGPFGLNPFQAGGVSTKSGDNPLVAPLSSGTMGLVDRSVKLGGANPLLGQAGDYLSGVLQPGYAAGLATSPQTQQAIQGAVNPLVSAFYQTAMPNMKAQFTASGQRIGNAISNPGMPGTGGLQKGSSAFDMAAGAAQNNLLEQVGQISSGITNATYQTGLQQQTQAINQAQALSTTEVNNLVSSLQASALPQMIQQYGITAGVQLFQEQVKNILQALGLSSVASQPAVGYAQSGSGSSSSSPGLVSGIGGALTGMGNVGTGLAALGLVL